MLNHDRRPLEALSEAPGHSVSGAQGTHSYFTVQIGKKKKAPSKFSNSSPAGPRAAQRAGQAVDLTGLQKRRLGADDASMCALRATPRGNTIKRFSVQLFTQLEENGPLTKPQQRRVLQSCSGWGRRAETGSQTAQPRPCPRNAVQGAKAASCPWSTSAKHSNTSAEDIFTASSS